MYVHEAVGANRRFSDLVFAVTPGIESNAPLPRQLLDLWGSVENEKIKYFYIFQV